MRFSPGVLDYVRGTGDGRRTRMDEALKRYVGQQVCFLPVICAFVFSSRGHSMSAVIQPFSNLSRRASTALVEA